MQLIYQIYSITLSVMKGEDTRDSQNVRGHFELFSHLLNVFKFYFISRKRCFRSLINANIKPITAEVAEKIDFQYACGRRTGTRQI